MRASRGDVHTVSREFCDAGSCVRSCSNEFCRDQGDFPSLGSFQPGHRVICEIVGAEQIAYRPQLSAGRKRASVRKPHTLQELQESVTGAAVLAVLLFPYLPGRRIPRILLRPEAVDTVNRGVVDFKKTARVFRIQFAGQTLFCNCYRRNIALRGMRWQEQIPQDVPGCSPVTDA
jgi:hypothetical protein